MISNEQKTNIPIWGKEIPGNHKESKKQYLTIGKKKPEVLMMVQAAMSMPGTEISHPNKVKERLDTYQYYHEIRKGYRKESFEDVPAIDYYPADRSDSSDISVLIIPGGGFTYQSNIGMSPEKQYEGGAMAMRLNEEGISAFVLSQYRLNPYHMPIPLLDAQRAVRFIRYHADEYHINPDKLGIMGFSAGGYEAAGVINLCRNQSVKEILEKYGTGNVEYHSDEVDKQESKVAFAGLIYPMLSFRSNVPMMYTTFGENVLQSQQLIEDKLQQYDLNNYVQSKDVPQFICMGTKDTMVDLTDDKTKYMHTLSKFHVPYEFLSIEGAGHGFGVNNKKYNYWTQKYIQWIKKLEL